MLKRPARTFVIVAVVLGAVALMRLWPERPAQSDAAPPLPSHSEAAQQASTETSGLPEAPSSERGSEGPVVPSTGPLGVTSAAPVPRQASVAPVRLLVRAPADVRVGQVFDVQIDLQAHGGLRDLQFTVRFSKSRLALTEWIEGDFAQQGGIPAETLAEEPSDGNVQVSFHVSDGLSIAGAGTMVTLRLEATRAGTSTITLGDVYAVGSNGIAEPGVAILETGAVTIH